MAPLRKRIMLNKQSTTTIMLNKQPHTSKNQEKNKLSPQLAKRKERTKRRTEINDIEMIKTTEKIDETKSCFFFF